MTKNDRAPIIAATPLHLLLCLVSLPALAAPAVTLTFTPGEQLALPISNSNPNVLQVPGDPIINISSASGMLTDKKATKSGAVVFSSTSDKPFTLFVETRLGQLFSVHAAPRKGEGRSYRLLAEKPVARPQAKAWETAQPYESMLAALNRSVLQGTLPEGYGPAPINKEATITVSGLHATPEVAWTGNALRIVRYRLVNRTVLPVALREQDFWQPGIRAVMVNPKYNRLTPGASTYLYVTRNQELADGKH